MTEEKWVVIKRYSFIHEAEIARANLQSAGYDVQLTNVHSMALQTFISEATTGIELLVPESVAVEAYELLEQDFSGALEEDDG